MSAMQDIAQRIAATACAALQDIKDGKEFPTDNYIQIHGDIGALFYERNNVLIAEMQTAMTEAVFNPEERAQLAEIEEKQKKSLQPDLIGTYAREFPDAEYEIPADILALLSEHGFIDQSWHNDISPSFTKEATRIRLWVKPTTEEERFIVELTDADGNPLDGDESVEISCRTCAQVREAMSVLESDGTTKPATKLAAPASEPGFFGDGARP